MSSSARATPIVSSQFKDTKGLSFRDIAGDTSRLFKLLSSFLISAHFFVHDHLFRGLLDDFFGELIQDNNKLSTCFFFNSADIFNVSSAGGEMVSLARF